MSRSLVVILLKVLASWGSRPVLLPHVHVQPTRGMTRVLGPQPPPPTVGPAASAASAGRRRPPPRPQVGRLTAVLPGLLFSLLSFLILPGGLPSPSPPGCPGWSVTAGVDSRGVLPPRLLCPCSAVWKMTGQSVLGMCWRTCCSASESGLKSKGPVGDEVLGSTLVSVMVVLVGLSLSVLGLGPLRGTRQFNLV